MTLFETVITIIRLKTIPLTGFIILIMEAKLLQKSEMRKDIVIELSYKGFS